MPSDPSKETPGEPKRNPSVFSEPFFNLEPPAEDGVRDVYLSSSAPDSFLGDEPALVASDAVPKQAATYGEWYILHKEHATPWLRAGWIFLVCCLGGPLAIFSALVFRNPTSTGGLLSVVLIAPIIEEILKIALPLIVIETRPYYFKNAFEIVGACMLSGAFFSAIENLLYIYFYIPDPSEFIIAWRWQVCSAMHIGATTIASLGLVRAWMYGDENLVRPPVSRGFPLFVTAMILHGTYNSFAIAMEYLNAFNM